jgi:hypothetical protein
VVEDLNRLLLRAHGHLAIGLLMGDRRKMTIWKLRALRALIW